MITAGFKNLMKQVLSSGGTSQGLLPIKDVGGTTRYLADYTAYPYTVSTTFTLTASDAGISVGTGNTASSENDYQLASTITSGLTGSVSVSKSVDSNDNSSIVLVVTLANTTGSDISISEIGYKQECSASDAQDGTTTTDRVFLVDRTVLATPITIPANGQGIIRYTLTTKYGSAGGVEDVLVNGTSVVTAGIARVTVPTVEANPSGTPTADLTKLQIGNGIYGVTNVSANVAVSTLAAPLTTLKIDDDEYTVSGGGGGTVYLPTLYSEEEREVGVWTDGKPLYQKTVDIGQLPSNTTKNVNHDIANIDKIVTVFGFAKDSTSATDKTIPLPYVNASNAGNQVQVEVYNTYIQVATKITAFSTYYGKITIQYTKTTDTPGSGTWTPDGQYAHHYSTTEHIIGTWTDGSTLYEITFTTPALTSNSWNENNLPVANIDKIVGHEILIDELQDSIPYTFSLGSADGGRYEAQFWHNRNADKYQMYVKAQGTVSNIYATITIRYTKTV